MFGNSSKGFTLLEVLIVLTIVSLLGAALAPNLRRENPAQERKVFIAELNNLMSYAWFNGITKDHVQRVVFDIQKNIIRLEEQTEKSSRPKQDATYAPIKQANLKTTMTWPKHFEIKNFFIEGYDEASKYAGSKTMDETWFFMVPDGLTQDVTLNIVDMKDLKSPHKGTPFSLVLNPFNAQFKEYKNFQIVK